MYLMRRKEKQFQNLGPPLMGVDLECKWKYISVINCHAPTENKEDQSKEKFYNQLKRVYDSISHRTRKIIIGYLNAKIVPLQRNTLTWISPDGHTKNQIDPVVVDEQLKHSIQDVRSYRGMSSHSDHFLVKIKLHIKLPIKWNQKRKTSRKFDIDKLKEEQIANEYIKGLKDKGDNNLNLNYQEHWTQLSKMIKEVVEEKNWYSEQQKDQTMVQ
ncbi:hypothetical protein QTP88_006878 [Uroleucon formosanum]